MQKTRRIGGLFMLEELQTLINQMVVFATLIVIGIGAQKLKLLNDANIDSITALIVKVTMPLLIITMIPAGGTKEDILMMFPFLLCAIFSTATVLSLGWISSRFLPLQQATKNIHAGCAGFGNTSFIGYPLILAMFPETGPLAIAVFALVDNLMVWTIGPILANPDVENKKIDFSRLVSPITISVIAGIVLLFFNIHPQNLAWQSLSDTGNMSKYLALLYIGADIGRKGLKRLFHRPIVLLTIPIKLIAAPAVVFFLLNLIGVISQEYIVILTVLSMTPTMVSISMQARMYGSDDEYASAAVIATSICSIITMPAMMWLVTHFI